MNAFGKPNVSEQHTSNKHCNGARLGHSLLYSTLVASSNPTNLPAYTKRPIHHAKSNSNTNRKMMFCVFTQETEMYDKSFTWYFPRDIHKLARLVFFEAQFKVIQTRHLLSPP